MPRAQGERLRSRRPSEYLAPTWSPFSLDYDSKAKDDGWEDDSGNSWKGIGFEFLDAIQTAHELSSTFCTVVDAQTSPAGGDPTGSFIRLRGHIVRCLNWQVRPCSSAYSSLRYKDVPMSVCYISVGAKRDAGLLGRPG